MYFPKEYDWNKEISFKQVCDDLDKLFSEMKPVILTPYPRRIDKVMFNKLRKRVITNETIPNSCPTGYGLGMQIIIDDHLCPTDEELNQPAKPKHKPFYKERNGKKLKKWEK